MMLDSITNSKKLLYFVRESKEDIYLQIFRTDVIILLGCETMVFCVRGTGELRLLPEPCELINGDTKNHDYKRK